MADTRTPAEVAEAERKAKAEADNEELTRDKTRAEFEEWKERRGERDAAAIKDLLPDLSKVERGATTVNGDATLYQALLGGRALEDAAAQLIRVIRGPNGLGDEYKVLLTTDLDIAARDANYQGLVKQIGLFQSLVDAFAAPRREIVEPLSIAAAAAQLLPGLLSLISAKRTLSTSSSTIDDTAALVAVAGALAGADREGLVVVEAAQLLDLEGPAQTAWSALQKACQDLAGRLDAEEAEDGHDEARIKEGRALLRSCQTALVAMTSVPEGAKLSPLATAALQEALHSDRFEGVLIVKGGAASSTQLVDDRPLLFGDPLSVVSTATISYLLIDHHDESRVLAAGLAHGVAQMHGKIGDRLELP